MGSTPGSTNPSPPRLAHSRWAEYLPLFALPLLAVPALAPLLIEGLPRSYDGGYHLLRLAVLDRARFDGVFLPRWAPEMLLGFGYPAFNFYGPASYYLAEALHLLGLGIQHAFMLAFAVAVVAAGYGVYLLARDVLGRPSPWPALVAAVAYMYAPYMMDNVYIRGGLAETMALAALPWILFAFRRLFYTAEPRGYFFLAAFSLALLAITHNITLLFAPPVLLGYLIVHWLRTGATRAVLRWPIASIAAAMGLSAYFWMPLILERSYLSEQAYTIAREVWLPISVWTWQNFLDTGFFFHHSFVRPNKLGLVQLVLAAGGFLMARRRDAEWLYLGAVALLAGMLIGAWALPLWQSSDVLSVAQFPWRLLSIITLPLALFSAGWLVNMSPGPRQIGAAAALIGLILVAQRPQMNWIDVFAPSEPDLSRPVLAQVEIEKGILAGGEGNSSIQEFRPRWAEPTLALREQPEAVDPAPWFAVTRADAYEMELTVRTAITSPVRFTDFYFPGWQVTIDGAPAPLYPSTSLGLLTVDVPPGEHTILKHWTHTPVQTAGTLLSMGTLALMIGIGLGDRRTRWLAIVPGVLLIAALAGWLMQATPAPVLQPATRVEQHGLALLGFQFDERDPARPAIRSYWSVSAPPGDVRIRWQLRDTDGSVVGDAVARPYYNAGTSELWPVGAIVDDASLAPIPAGLPAGNYHLAVALERADSDEVNAPIVVGAIDIENPRVDPAPQNTTAARIGNDITLQGYTYALNGRPVTGDALPHARPGDYLWVTLFWSAEAPPPQNYHAFVHLVDATGLPIAQEDHIPGPLFHAPASWIPGRVYTDAYLLRIPPDARGGVYWPAVGMYDFGSQERQPVYTQPSMQAGDAADHVLLAPIKLVDSTPGAVEHSKEARFGANFELLGYDLATPGATLRAGDTISVTFTYRGIAPTSTDLTRFVHLYSPELGMAAQYDSPPAGGINPTSTWVEGEIVRDPVTLTVGSDVRPGNYQLFLGFYDTNAGAVRLPVTDAQGAPFVDALVPVVEMSVVP